MELRILKYFLTVAREENITRAANLLHVTQPTLSRQLMQLEDELGVKLFCRSKHRITLTDEGLLLKRRAQEITELAERTTQRSIAQQRKFNGRNRNRLRRSKQYFRIGWFDELFPPEISAGALYALFRHCRRY